MGGGQYWPYALPLSAMFALAEQLAAATRALARILYAEGLLAFNPGKS